MLYITVLARTVCVAAMLVLALVSVAPVLAQQNEEAIREMLEERDRAIKDLVGTSDEIPAGVKEELRTVINEVIDFNAMSRDALGRYWNDLTDEQKAEFVGTFSQIVRTQSLANLDVYRSQVTYDEIAIDGLEAHVVTTTTYKDVPTKVEYDLVFRDDGWFVTDITLDRVSTVKSYARSFQSVIRKRGFTDLMTKLHEKLDEVEGSVS